MNLELHLTANLAPLLAFLLFAAFMVGVPVLTVLATNAQRGRAVRELEAFAALLEGGEAHTARADYWSGLTACSAAGRLEGHPVRVSFARRGAGKHAHTAIVYAVQVQHPAASFEVAEVDGFEALSRLVGVTSTDALQDQDLVLRKGGAPAARLLQAADVRAALEAILRREGVSGVALEGTTLRVEQRAAIRAGPMRDTLRPLLRLAALVARRPVELRVAPRAPAEPTPAPAELAARFAWTGGGEAARCPYCRDELDAAAPEAAACDRCRTVHHRECLDEAGGCTVFGCGAKERAPDGPRIRQ